MKNLEVATVGCESKSLLHTTCSCTIKSLAATLAFTKSLHRMMVMCPVDQC